MVRNKSCGGRAPRITVGITVLAILLLAGGAGAAPKEEESMKKEEKVMVCNKGKELRKAVYRSMVEITILAILLAVGANATHGGGHWEGRTGDSLYVK